MKCSWCRSRRTDGGTRGCPSSRKPHAPAMPPVPAAATQLALGCPHVPVLRSAALSRNGAALCWATGFLLETWKSSWPRGMSDGLLPNSGEPSQFMFLTSPFLLQEKEEILV